LFQKEKHQDYKYMIWRKEVLHSFYNRRRLQFMFCPKELLLHPKERSGHFTMHCMMRLGSEKDEVGANVHFGEPINISGALGHSK
jgi:hypothetical protein